MIVLNNNKNKEFVFLLCSFVLPFLYTCLWFFKNNQLPISDATDYILTGVNYYRNFQEHGFWSGLSHLYSERGWRPILFGVFLVPFLSLSKGNVFFAYHAVALSCVAISGMYVYLLFRLQLDRLAAIIATNLIILLPLVQTQALVFFAESALFPCVFAALYHLIKSNYFLDKKHAIGFILFFSLGIMIRPVEAMTHFGFIMSVFLFWGWRNHVFSIKQITLSLALSFSTLFFICFLAVTHFFDHYPFAPIDGGVYDKKLTKALYYLFIASFASLILSWALVWIAQRFSKLETKSLLVMVFCSILTFVMLWFGPFAFQTLLWIYRTSIGDIALSSGMQIGKPFWQGLHGFIAESSQLTIYALIVLAILATGLIGKTERKNLFTTTLFIYLLLLTPFAFWQVFHTIQNTSRKLSIALPALLMTLLLISLARGRLRKMRLVVVTALLMMQFIFVMSFIFPKPIKFETLNGWLGSYPKPTVIEPNPHLVVLNFLTEQASKNNLHRVAIELNVELAKPVDIFLLRLQGLLTKQAFKIDYPYYINYSLTNPYQLSQQADAVFLSDKLSDMTISSAAEKHYLEKYSQEQNPTLKTLYQFLLHYSQNKLNGLGWDLGPCIVVKSTDGDDYLGCLLLSQGRSKL